MEGNKKSAVTFLLLICCACQVQKKTNLTHSENTKNKHQIAVTMNPTSFALPTLKYKLDTRSKNPFDVNATENIFFYDGGFSCLVNDRKELDSFHDQSKAYVVFELERVDLVQNGNILKYFEALEISKDSMLYRLNRKNQYVILASQQVLQYLHKGSETIAYQSFQINHSIHLSGIIMRIVWRMLKEIRQIKKMSYW